jgi:hypothetical protein
MGKRDTRILASVHFYIVTNIIEKDTRYIFFKQSTLIEVLRHNLYIVIKIIVQLLCRNSRARFRPLQNRTLFILIFLIHRPVDPSHIHVSKLTYTIT